MLSSRSVAQKRALMYQAERYFRKTATPGFYNLRFKPSYGHDNVYYHDYASFQGPNGPEAAKTERDPTKFRYNNNIFSLDYMEWRTRGGDYIYQQFKRLHRSNDGWTRCLVGYTTFCFLMANQALFWKVHLFFFGLFTATRIRDKGHEPTLDEV